MRLGLPKRRCYGNHLILRSIHTFTAVDIATIPSLIALAFDNRLDDREAFFRYGDDSATSFTNLVSFHSVTAEITSVKRANSQTMPMFCVMQRRQRSRVATSGEFQQTKRYFALTKVTRIKFSCSRHAGVYCSLLCRPGGLHARLSDAYVCHSGHNVGWRNVKR